MAKQVELLGAQANAVHLDGPAVDATVQLDQTASRKTMRSFAPQSRGTPAEPDRVFLNLENITGSSDATSFKVYVGLKPNDDPDQHAENLAGVVTLFGVSDATAPNSPHGGNGLNKVIEITKVVDRLHLAGAEALNEIPVRFALRRGQTSDVRIGRISIYRQGS